jgi:hypothetical protein
LHQQIPHLSVSDRCVPFDNQFNNLTSNCRISYKTETPIDFTKLLNFKTKDCPFYSPEFFDTSKIIDDVDLNHNDEDDEEKEKTHFSDDENESDGDYAENNDEIEDADASDYENDEDDTNFDADENIECDDHEMYKDYLADSMSVGSDI